MTGETDQQRDTHTNTQSLWAVKGKCHLREIIKGRSCNKLVFGYLPTNRRLHYRSEWLASLHFSQFAETMMYLDSMASSDASAVVQMGADSFTPLTRMEEYWREVMSALGRTRLTISTVLAFSVCAPLPLTYKSLSGREHLFRVGGH